MQLMKHFVIPLVKYYNDVLNNVVIILLYRVSNLHGLTVNKVYIFSFCPVIIPRPKTFFQYSN